AIVRWPPADVGGITIASVEQRGAGGRRSRRHTGRTNQYSRTMRSVVYMPGDGIGPSIVEATRTILTASGADIEWVEAAAGLGAFEKYGDPLPAATIEAIRLHKVALKGPLTTPVGTGFRS